MKKQQQEIVTEITRHLDEWVSEEQTVNPDWLTKAIVDGHPDISGADREWYVMCAYGYVRDMVRHQLGRFKSSQQTPDHQSVLPGFEYLQRSYLIERGGEQTIVPIHQLSDAELEAKAIEYEQMADGCQKHAVELRRYKKMRSEKAQ